MLTRQERMELDALLPSLAGLPRDLGKRLSEESKSVQIDPDIVAFEEGDACTGLLIPSTGAMRVSKISAEGRELLLYEVRPGDLCVLSLACLLGGESYPARGVTSGEVRGALIPLGLFRDLIDEVPIFRAAVFADLGQRVTQLMRLVEEVAFQRLDRRLAQFLVREVNGGAEHALALTHQEIAERLGTAREIVSRVLGSFALQGFVELGRKRVRVIDIPSLRSVAGAPDPA